MTTESCGSPITKPKEVETICEISLDNLDQTTSGRCVITSIFLQDAGMFYQANGRTRFVFRGLDDILGSRAPLFYGLQIWHNAD
jgi:hypothetical protein